MKDISLHKTELRMKQRELRGLPNEWDPLEVAEAVPDEYDCLFGPVSQLYRGSSEAEVAAYLREQLREHFGVDPDEFQPEAFAHRVFEGAM